MTELIKNSHCSWCGHGFDVEAPWPRTCAGCGRTSWLNPLPVSVLLVPVGEAGVLCVRRGIEPHKGKLALVGGFIEVGETWQEAGAREAREEAQVDVDPDSIREFRVRSAPDETVLIFGEAAPLDASAIDGFAPNHEVSELVVLTEPAELAFSLHTDAVEAWFADLATRRS